MNGHRSTSEYRTRLIGLLALKIFFTALYMSKDKSETEALIKGLSKAKTRQKVEL